MSDIQPLWDYLDREIVAEATKEADGPLTDGLPYDHNDSGGFSLIVPSAGISAGIDASPHLVSRLEGAAAEVAKVMEYPWEPEEQAASH